MTSTRLSCRDTNFCDSTVLRVGKPTLVQGSNTSVTVFTLCNFEQSKTGTDDNFFYQKVDDSISPHCLDDSISSHRLGESLHFRYASSAQCYVRESHHYSALPRSGKTSARYSYQWSRTTIVRTRLSNDSNTAAKIKPHAHFLPTGNGIETFLFFFS